MPLGPRCTPLIAHFASSDPLLALHDLFGC
jgi:hypothetical protein